MFLKHLKLILLYIGIYIICSIVFVAMMHIPCNFSFMNVLMYKGLVWIIFSGIISAILMMLAKSFFQSLHIDVKDIILMFFIFCCINTVLFTLIPVTVERSVSVFMLSYMEQCDESVTQDDIENAFNEKYVNEFGAFEKRFQEQIVSGNIEKSGTDEYRLTNNGERMVSFFRMVAKLFDTDQRLVYPMGGN